VGGGVTVEVEVPVKQPDKENDNMADILTRTARANCGVGILLMYSIFIPPDMSSGSVICNSLLSSRKGMAGLEVRGGLSKALVSHSAESCLRPCVKGCLLLMLQANLDPAWRLACCRRKSTLSTRHVGHR
jgi:hypothetical protein